MLTASVLDGAARPPCYCPQELSKMLTDYCPASQRQSKMLSSRDSNAAGKVLQPHKYRAPQRPEYKDLSINLIIMAWKTQVYQD